MTFISTISKKFANKKTARDVYFESLEEAYGNLPVPSDDYADIKVLLLTHLKSKKKEEIRNLPIENFVDSHFSELETAIETIREHYSMISEALRKEGKYL